MKKNEHRKLAEKAFLDDRGRITNKDLAERFGIHPATVARWKKMDEWDLKLVRSVTSQDDAGSSADDDFQVDLRHINLLNERIDVYLQKKELLPSEILQLAEAKLHLMNCMEIMDGRSFYPRIDGFDKIDNEFE